MIEFCIKNNRLYVIKLYDYIGDMLKRFAIHLIRFCLKCGITENKDIIKFLEENEEVLKGKTFDRYKSIVEQELENALDADIW